MGRSFQDDCQEKQSDERNYDGSKTTVKKREDESTIQDECQKREDKSTIRRRKTNVIRLSQRIDSRYKVSLHFLPNPRLPLSCCEAGLPYPYSLFSCYPLPLRLRTPMHSPPFLVSSPLVPLIIRSTPVKPLPTVALASSQPKLRLNQHIPFVVSSTSRTIISK